MAPPPDATRSQTFVIHVQRDRQALRGQVVAVADGATRLFEDLDDAVAFILARIDQREQPPGGAR